MRPYDLPDFDAAFTDRWLADDEPNGTVSGPLDVDPDIDSSASGLIGSIVDRLFPERLAAEIAVRADACTVDVRHAGTFLYLIQASLTISVIVIAVMTLTKIHLASLFLHSVLTPSVVIAVFGALALPRGTSGCGVFVLWGTVVLFLSLGLWDQQFLPITAQLVLWALTVVALAEPTRGTLRALILIYAIFPLARSMAMKPEIAATWFDPAVVVAWLSLVGGGWLLTHHIYEWMHANPGAIIDFDERTDDQVSDPAESLDFQRGSGQGMMSVSGVLTALAAYYLLAFTVRRMGELAHAPQLQLKLIVRSMGYWICIGSVNWAACEVLFHRRIPSLSSFGRSIYAVWRLVAVWTTYRPVVLAPTVFHFARPWSNATLRRVVLCCVIGWTSTPPLGVVWNFMWGLTTTPSPSSQSQAHTPTVPKDNSTDRAIPAASKRVAHAEAPFDWAKWERRFTRQLITVPVVILTGAYFLIVPAGCFLVGLWAIWGPLLGAGHDALERRFIDARLPMFGQDWGSSREFDVDPFRENSP